MPHTTSRSARQIDILIQVRQFLTDTAQTSTPLYQVVDRALSSMSCSELQAAIDEVSRHGWLLQRIGFS
jgi:hypothetical protein